MASKALLADSLYGSDENIETAKDKKVDVVSPPISSEKKDQLSLKDFHL
jgi:hypothetical protein